MHCHSWRQMEWGAVVLLHVISVALAQDYCGKFGSGNTMCRYPEGTKGCRSTASGTDSVSIEDILSTHNKYRQRVANGEESPQPSASNMNELVWDPELAEIAQRWADQCNFEHDSNRLTFGFPNGVGQNIAYTGASNSDGKADFGEGAIKMWYDEVESFSPSSIDPFRFSGGTGHYSQVVWAETYAIGCGFNLYPAGGMQRKYYVCNYGPAGNFGGRAMYKKGKPCSACSSGICSTKYDGLCQRKPESGNLETTKTELNGTRHLRNVIDKYLVKNFIIFRT